MFNMENSSSQGVYSIHMQDTSLQGGQHGLPNTNYATDLILSFECKEDALRYAGLLEAIMSSKPCVYSLSPVELTNFCLEWGYMCWLQPKGQFITPPEKNMKCTDWERDMLQLQMHQELQKQKHKQDENLKQEVSSQLFWSRDDEDEEDLDSIKSWLEQLVARE
eukprot:TRINITY_DN39518_c0_g1_i2.p3 TRINITY_DN39518_c0_g1~~TRINITY_DN39518_c0_g1_i2.p3  ORF type:complete len:181 (+),score=12.17 TRINITY_DN39518_c0_g1_i2:54-545(+)